MLEKYKFRTSIRYKLNDCIIELITSTIKKKKNSIPIKIISLLF